MVYGVCKVYGVWCKVYGVRCKVNGVCQAAMRGETDFSCTLLQFCQPSRRKVHLLESLLAPDSLNKIKSSIHFFTVC